MSVMFSRHACSRDMRVVRHSQPLFGAVAQSSFPNNPSNGHEGNYIHVVTKIIMLRYVSITFHFICELQSGSANGFYIAHFKKHMKEKYIVSDENKHFRFELDRKLNP